MFHVPTPGIVCLREDSLWVGRSQTDENDAFWITAWLAAAEAGIKK